MSAADPTQRVNESNEHGVRPAGEEIHLPGPSIIPLVCAIGITLTVIGTTIDWIWSALGLIIFIISVAVWIRDTRRDVEALPEEHRH